MEAACFKRSFWSRRLKNPGSSENTDWYTNNYIMVLYELSICLHIVQVQSQFPVQITIKTIFLRNNQCKTIYGKDNDNVRHDIIRWE